MTLAVMTVAAMWYRRPDQFTHPYVWAEDGIVNLPQFADQGWGILWTPLAGYFLLPARLIFAMSAAVSFRWLPELSFWLTLLFTYGVVATVASAPTRLRFPFLCALATLLVPSGSEVFAVGLNTGWWGSLLLMLGLVWKETEQTRTCGFRLCLVGIGGLSTPLVIALTPLFALRAFWFRHRCELVMLTVCASLAVLQLAALGITGPGLEGRLGPLGTTAGSTVAKFFGHYLFWNPNLPDSALYIVLGLSLIGLLGYAALFRARELDWPFFFLLGCLACAVALSVIRAPLEFILAPVAGSRYFFLPFVLLSWTLTYLLDTRWQATFVFAAAALVASAGMAASIRRHTHAPVDWRGEIERCMRSDVYTLPIHSVGDAAPGAMWEVAIAGEACRTLVANSLFDSRIADSVPVREP